MILELMRWLRCSRQDKAANPAPYSLFIITFRRSQSRGSDLTGFTGSAKLQ